METLREPIDRLAPSARPRATPIGYQRWTDLTFLHWPVPAESLASLLPPELSVDTFQGMAWVGLVPFYMSRVRPWWFFPVPGVSAFCETNVRTYVHCDGKHPGVWFFSLDASRALPVQIARKRWQLNYHYSRMHRQRTGNAVRYASHRLWPGTPGAGSRVDVVAGDPIGAASGDFVAGRATPGTLEHFLAERYLLYTLDPSGRLLRGQVHHRPYPLREARVDVCEETLLRAAGITVDGPPRHALFSDGVDVEIFPLQAVAH